MKKKRVIETIPEASNILMLIPNSVLLTNIPRANPVSFRLLYCACLTFKANE